MAEDDRTKVANEALARLAATPIMAFDDETPTAAKVARIFPTVVAAAFDSHRWNFARRTTRLDRLNIVPETGFAYAYALPGNRIGDPVRVLTNPRNVDNPLRTFVVEGGELHADAGAVWATCVIAVEPPEWPPLFRFAVAVALAAELAVPLTHDTGLKDRLDAEAWGTPQEGRRGGLIGRAIARDAAGTPGPAPVGASDVLTGARYDGPWYGAG